MSKIAKMVLTLTILGLISGLVLSLVANYADPFIKQNEQKALREAVFFVLPATEYYEERQVKGEEIYECYNAEDELIGYAFTASGGGYQGTIELMFSVGTGLEEIKGIQILTSEETPGLGGKIRGENFKSQFRGLDASQGVGLVKSEEPERGEIQAITGATISSRALVDIINQELARVKTILSSGE